MVHDMTQISIAGQDVELTYGGNYKINIKTIFKSAGLIYKFPQNSSGISFNEDIVALALKNNKWIFVTIGSNTTLYRIHPKRIIEIIKRFNSIYEKNGLRLYVIPLRSLTRVS
jgi:hypothetical protein